LLLRKSQRRSILTPVAYSEALMPSLQLARSSRQARRIAVDSVNPAHRDNLH
jgi:hypothetical protein